MRILHLTGTIATEAGGVARSVMDTSKALAGEGIEVEILSQQIGHIDLPWKGEPPANLSLHLARKPVSLRFPSADMRRILPQHIAQCDILHLHGMWQMLNNIASNHAIRLGKPYVCSIRGMLDPWSMQQRGFRKRLYYKFCEKKRLSNTAAIHFTAEDELKKARMWVPDGVRTEVVPNVINLGLFLDLPSRTSAYQHFPQVHNETNGGGPWVLFLSRIHEKKGLNFLIEAFSKLPPGLANAQLLIAGSGEQSYIDTLKRQVAGLNMQSRIHFVGMVQGVVKAALYRTADVLAIPTSQENFGLVFPEALACETSVMLTEGVDIHREILAANAGYLITQDVENIRQTLITALSNREENRRKGEAGRRWVLENLQPGNIAKRWRQIYESILSK